MLQCLLHRSRRRKGEDIAPDDCASFFIFSRDQANSSVSQPVCIPHNEHQIHSSTHSSASCLQDYRTYDSSSEIQDYTCSSSFGPKSFECPSIQITSISPSCHQDIGTFENAENNRPERDYMDRPLRDHLCLHLEPSFREPSLSPSPGSSISSRSWISDASSCESLSHIYDDLDSELNEAAARFTLGSPLTSPSGSPREHPVEKTWHVCSVSPSSRQSPCHSPRNSITDENWLSPRPSSKPPSRPTSPCGKRRHSSADIFYSGLVSPHYSPATSPGPSPRGSITEDSWLNASPHPVPSLSLYQCWQETAIPLKTRKTSEDHSARLAGKTELNTEDLACLSPTVDMPTDESACSQHPVIQDSSTDQFLSVPSHFTWNKHKSGHTPVFRTSSLPPLDWALPSRYGQYELKVDVQPKTHHRAHYETEGSRGAVKAVTGNHPIVKLTGYTEKPLNLQMFIGTADDRYVRPHAFYQVHRITGKTVATASQEIVITNTKVLEIPLLPENNMTASIDCAGILKLRNSDIELRKGETDIGRKNTRVRLVFRVHIPQTSGKVLSLQAASVPIECSQRSAQELPQVEKYSINSCSVNGGLELVITGSNFMPDSKVIFLEKGQDGCTHWEAEGKTVFKKCQMNNIVVEIPAYHNKTIAADVQVQFYVCNGKRKRSQSQRFNYTPVLLKQENLEDGDLQEATAVSLAKGRGISDLRMIHTSLLFQDQRSICKTLKSSSPPGVECPTQPTFTSSLKHEIPQISKIQEPCTSSSPSTADPETMENYPVSIYSSPQKQSMPYQCFSPDIPVLPSSSLTAMPHTGQPSSHTHDCRLRGISLSPTITHPRQNSASSHPTDMSLGIKAELVDHDINFQTKDLEDITLDDVAEIIRRDMSH
ncbi:nuclear factor of activated T-cells, cytoplasmic 3 isoform X1 [Xenopus tropicalis]|uniref:Nuclear factor of activated T-cells, cytoplasmic 3 isoform X1 n=1 Tax=Xenopus tropicalis TaxID=8364 RepID=A0A803K607_XENTR|nr:nuclear factor of activated T-cells, cytoplasmic 3 isoform X1 [Xenopus tropicalis]